MNIKDQVKHYWNAMALSPLRIWRQKVLCAVFMVAFAVLFSVPVTMTEAGTVKKVDVHPINNWSVELDPGRVHRGAVCSLSRSFFKGYALHVARDSADVVSVILVPPPEPDKWYGNIMGVKIGSENEDVEQISFVPRTKRVVGSHAAGALPTHTHIEGEKLRRDDLKEHFRQTHRQEEPEPQQPAQVATRLEYVLERHVSFYEDYMEDSFVKVELEKLSYNVLLAEFSDAMQLLEGCTITKTGRVSEYEEEKLEREVKDFYQDNPSLLPDLIRKNSDRSILLKSTQSDGETPEEEVVDEDLVESLTRKLTILEREKEALRGRLNSLEDSDLSNIRNNTMFAKEKEIYEKQISYLNKQIEALHKENAKVRQSKVRYKEVIVPANKEEMAATKERLTALEDQNSKLRSEIDYLKRKSSRSGLSDKSASEIKALEEELALLDRLNKRLSKRQEVMDILMANNVEPDPLLQEGDVLALTNRTQSLYEDTKDMDIRYKEQGRVNVLGRMNQDLLDQVTDLEVEMMDVKEQNTMLSRENASLKKENEQLLKDIDSLSEGYKSLEERIAQKKEDLDIPIDPEANITKMTYDTLDIYDGLDGMGQQQGRIAMRAADDASPELINQLKELQVQNEQLAKQNNAQEQQYNQLAEQKSVQEEQYNQLVQQKSAQEEQYNQLVEQTSNQEEQYNQLLDKHNALKEQVQKDGFDTAQAKQLQQMEKRVTALTEQNTLLVKELEDLGREAASAKQLSGAQDQDGMLALEGQIQILKQENEQLRETVKKPTQANETFNPQSQLTDRIKTLNSQNMALVSEIRRLKTDLDAEKQRVAEAPVVIPQQLAERDEQIDRQKREISGLIAENEKLRLQIDEMASKGADMLPGQVCEANNMQQMNNRIAALTHTNRMLSRKIDELESGIRPSNQDVIPVMPQLDPDYEATAPAQASDQNSDKMIAALREENSRLRAELKEAAKAAVENNPGASCMSNQAMDIQEKIYLLEQENERLKSRLDQAQ